MKTAILVDGGFYTRRAQKVSGDSARRTSHLRQGLYAKCDGYTQKIGLLPFPNIINSTRSQS